MAPPQMLRGLDDEGSRRVTQGVGCGAVGVGAVLAGVLGVVLMAIVLSVSPSSQQDDVQQSTSQEEYQRSLQKDADRMMQNPTPTERKYIKKLEDEGKIPREDGTWAK